MSGIAGKMAFCNAKQPRLEDPHHMKSHFAALLVLLSSTSSALSADGAKFRAIGFSPDSRYFAFEQYGVQDGSGFNYADVFVLDIEKDAWASGTPIKTLVEDESMSVAKARATSKQDAAGVLQRANISVDAELLAATPFSEVVGDRARMTFHDHYNNSMGMFGTADQAGSWELKTTNVPVPLPEGCETDIGVTGYKLELKNNKTGLTDILHQDTSLPKSRSCAVGYDLEAVVQPVAGAENGQLVAIIGVYSRGFEGADRRFIAVPFKMN
jgi:predicted secreted protein